MNAVRAVRFMWKWLFIGAFVVVVLESCADPGCIRNSQCLAGYECRANKCQVPLPPVPVAGAPVPCRGVWCPWLQDGGVAARAGAGGREPVNTSTRYKDGGPDSGSADNGNTDSPAPASDAAVADAATQM